MPVVAVVVLLRLIPQVMVVLGVEVMELILLPALMESRELMDLVVVVVVQMVIPMVVAVAPAVQES